MKIELNNEQVFAVYEGENWWRRSNEQVFEICGPAGTGKTFLVRYLMEHFGLTYDEVLFVAYMGKAAMALSRNGLPARTIHSTIYEYTKILDKTEDGKIQFNEKGRPKTKWVFIKRERIHSKVRLIIVDEGSTVSEEIAKDLLSFGVPIIVLGDLNQLPPVFGHSYFLKNPNVVLTEIMRQAKDNPIIYLSQLILAGEKLTKGIYGNCAVIGKTDLNEFMFNEADIVLTCTNRLRYEINTLFREHLRKGLKLDKPNIGEKIICRKNNWGKCIDDIYLTNGMSGFVEYVDIESFNGKQLKIDFRADFMDKQFKNLLIDYESLFATPEKKDEEKPFDFNTRNKFEFGYAITTHLSQGSQYDNVLFLGEKMNMPKDTYKKLLYTAVTRARKKITVAI